jgi:hypothetical protein
MDIKQIVSDLHSQRTRLERAISALEGLVPRRGPERAAKSASAAPVKKRRRMSAEARKRIGEAKRKWWAERKRKKK